MSLRPEFITPQDGAVKQDCEINAAKRWLAAHAARYATGNDTLLGDDLDAHQPFCRQVLRHGLHFLFTCKPTSHTHLIPKATQAKLRAEHARLDPFELKKNIEIKLRKFFTALGNLNREATKP